MTATLQSNTSGSTATRTGKAVETRYRPGPVPGMRKYQKSNDLILKKLPFERLVREIGQEVSAGCRFQSTAVLALQEAAEAVLISLFEDSALIALKSRRLKVMPRDLHLAIRIRGDRS